MVIVNVALTKDENMERNIFSYDSNGTLVWIIQEGPIKIPGRRDYYQDIWVENGRLIAGNTIGYDYYVDLATGEVTCKNPNARPW